MHVGCIHKKALKQYGLRVSSPLYSYFLETDFLKLFFGKEKNEKDWF